MEQLPHIIVQAGSGHPWLSWKQVAKPEERVAPGSVVDFVDRKGRWVGRGFFNAHARIRGRVLTRSPVERVDEKLIAERITRAVDLRKNVLGLEKFTNAYRVVNSEGDDLSGLVVDVFNNLIVIEYFAHGMFKFRNAIKKALESHYPNAQFHSLAQRHVQKQECFDHPIVDLPNEEVITENGIKFAVRPGVGQKTGFFADQRENRKYFSGLTQGKEVLDLCSHTGGFSLYALTLGGAKSALAVDRDTEVLALAELNAALNKVKLETLDADLFPFMENCIRDKKKFGVVVLDPPKQTRSEEGIASALRRYFAMNVLAMQLVEPGGLFISCSCSGLIKEDEFVETLREAAFKSNRKMQLLQLTGAGADHPIHPDVPEGRYLKVAWCRL